MSIKTLGKGTNYREIGDNFVVGASTACEKVNTADTNKNLYRLVSVLGYGARVLPLELAPVPGHGAQISARAPTKGYVQTRARAAGTGKGTKSERGLKRQWLCENAMTRIIIITPVWKNIFVSCIKWTHQSTFV